MSTFKVGSVVRFKGGGPLLTVSSITGDCITVEWILPSGRHKQISCPSDCFDLVIREADKND